MPYAAPETDLRLHLDRLERYARLLDSAIRVPGTDLRIGLDALLGLIPGLGDALGTLLSLYIVWTARRWQLPVSVRARMLANVVIDGVLGSVPLIGDLFDLLWRANLRNVQLLRAYQDAPAATTRMSRLWMGLGLALVVAVLAGMFALAWVTLAWVASMVRTI